MKTVNIHEAKTHLSKLVEGAVNGEPFVIAKAGRPLVRVEALTMPGRDEVKAARFPARRVRDARRLRSHGAGGDRDPVRHRLMKCLLDTHLLIWAASDPARLSSTARERIEDIDNDLYFSVASLWEIVIKNALGRADFRVDASRLRRGLSDNDYVELGVEGNHVLAVASLPALHRDPFDRVLIAQAKVEGLMLLTADGAMAGYGSPVSLVS